MNAHEGASALTYLDHAATTPMRAEVKDAMGEVLDVVGNPSSVHRPGQAARRLVDDAREEIAAALGCDPIEVIFTSGGTEANNLAVKGGFWARNSTSAHARLALSRIEHHAVLDPAEWLARSQGAQLAWLEVDADGVVDLTAAAAVLGDGQDVALLSVMWANNETGTVQPITQLAALAEERGIPFHTDAVQALGAVEVNFAASGVGALSLSGHKLGGPPGIGALLARRTFVMQPISHGGGQERQVRSGTLNVPGAVGLAAAVTLAVAERAEHTRRLTALRDHLVAGVLALVPEARVNGGAHRLPGHAHFTFPACVGDDVLLLLDQRGIAVSTGSACTAGVSEASHVLMAMGSSELEAREVLRVTLGRTSTERDVQTFLDVLPDVLAHAKAVRS